MACYHPITIKDPSNKNLQITVPCGKCIGCKLDHSVMWMVRCEHEMYFTDKSTFITLTYDDENLTFTRGGKATLNRRDLELFLKRVRKKRGKIRYFACGEYGEKNDRPHYHICIFGYEYDDQVFDSVSQSGFQLNTSKKLTDDWKNGRCVCQEMTIETAAYAARYCTKKITGEIAEKYYDGREPEFAVMSRRPGIGREFYNKYKNDMLNNDVVITKEGIKTKTPRYYLDILKSEDVERREEIAKKRKEKLTNENYIDLIRKRNVKLTINKKNKKRKYEGEKNEYL